MTLPRRDLLASAYLALGTGGGGPGRQAQAAADGSLRNDLAQRSGASLIATQRAGPGAARRSLAEKVSDFISLRDYGAVGNGTTSGGGADDTIAVQGAIDANPGRTIIDGGGLQYRISAPLKIPTGHSYLTIQNATFITTGNHSAFESKTGLPGTNTVSFFTLDRVQINCDSHTADGVCGFDFSDFSMSLFRQVWFLGALGKSVGFYGAGNVSVGEAPYYNKFDQCYFGLCKVGIKLEDSRAPAAGCNSIQIMSSRFQPQSGNTGIHVGVLNQNITILGCTFEAYGGTGIHNAGEATMISSSRFESMTTAIAYAAQAVHGIEYANYYSSNTANRTFTGDSADANTVLGEYVEGGRTSHTLAGVTTSKGGFRLPNTEVEDANTLDYYAEASFTPVVAGTRVGGTGTYDIQSGRYTRVGRKVDVTIAVVWSGHTGAGGIVVRGLPFVIKNEAGVRVNFEVVPENLAFSGLLVAQGAPNTSTITISTANPGSALTAVPLDTAASLYITGSYDV